MRSSIAGGRYLSGLFIRFVMKKSYHDLSGFLQWVRSGQAGSKMKKPGVSPALVYFFVDFGLALVRRFPDFCPGFFAGQLSNGSFFLSFSDMV